MSGTRPQPTETTNEAALEARLLAWDLACVAGASSEIATTWRRADHGLPLELPEQLHDAARRLEAAAWLLAASGPDQAARQAAGLVRRVSALADEAAAVHVAGGGDGPGVGDALLWDSVTTALRDAADHASHLAAR